MNNIHFWGFLQQKTLQDRVILTSGLITFFILGYFSVAFSINPSHSYTLATPIDERIPFLAFSIWIYLWVFPAAMSPLFVVRCPYLFRRTAISYGVILTISFLFFAIFPVTASQLRVISAMLDVTDISQWAVYVLYSLDPPYNLFPSLHLSIAALAAFSVWRVSKLYGIILFLSVGCVALAVCTVKQHYLLDVFGGLMLATLVSFFIIRPYQPQYRNILTYSWRGPAWYLAFVSIYYATLCLIYFLK